MKKIQGLAKTIRQLLSGAKYAIDYYQREYRWQSKQVEELIDDLTDKFLEDYQPQHERSAVEHYGHYFLGSIIISEKDNHRFIIDGQQRLTTLTLLLICLYNKHPVDEDKSVLQELILSRVHGRRSFNIDVDDRTPCMEALFRGEPFDTAEASESIRNIAARYQDIQERFPSEINETALPYFADWLIENVHLVEITAFSDEDAYTIFETMNDRGLSLTSTEMLKGYILANIMEPDRRLEANRIWRERVGALNEIGKDEDSDAIKAWLRSQYAQTIRERKKGAVPGDFDRLGTEFHRWVREEAKTIRLERSSEFLRFIQRDFNFYTRQYCRIREAAQELIAELELIFYVAQHKFTLQYPLLLAPLTPEDNEPTVRKKLRIVSSYLDILIARRLWNFRDISYSTVQYAMFLVMREIRGKQPAELAAILKSRLNAEEETFSTNERLRLHQQNGHSIHRLLARIMDHVEARSGNPSRLSEYVAEGRNRYELEHIWANHPQRHVDEFPHPADFTEYRNRIGGLLLLPKSFNASYGDLPYQDKLEHYYAQNMLARSLHPQCYDHNPGFVSYVQRSGLPFRSHPEFKRQDLDLRQDLYSRIAQEIWDPARIDREASS